jgi:hypothetical protein
MAAKLLMLLLGTISAKLSVLSPESLVSQFTSKFNLPYFLDGTILASYANFGYIPYG